MNSDPFTLDEVNAYIEVLETLHPPQEARSIAAAWSGDKRFTRTAFNRLVEYLQSDEQ